jgi:hypothetical protein
MIEGAPTESLPNGYRPNLFRRHRPHDVAPAAETPSVASGVEMFRMLEGDDAANALRAIARPLEDVDEPDAGETLRAIAEALEDAE